eukprot:1160446-Pelagomonas_calceolata.AAC.9
MPAPTSVWNCQHGVIGASCTTGLNFSLELPARGLRRARPHMLASGAVEVRGVEAAEGLLLVEVAGLAEAAERHQPHLQQQWGQSLFQASKSHQGNRCTLLHLVASMGS